VISLKLIYCQFYLNDIKMDKKGYSEALKKPESVREATLPEPSHVSEDKPDVPLQHGLKRSASEVEENGEYPIKCD